MELSIIIVNWNGGDMLRDCLSSISRTQGDLRLQVIVVDNASRDGSRELAQRDFPQFQIINSGSNLGFGRANNHARSLVQSDLVLFLNPDTVLLENSLVRMVEFLHQHPEVGALGCKMRSPGGEVHGLGIQQFPSPWTEFLNLLFVSSQTRRWFSRRLPLPDPNTSNYVTKLYGGCLMCRRQALDQAGWFDERYFMYAEDVDLCKSIHDRGWKIYYLSTAEVIHVAGGTSNKAPSGFSILMKSESVAKLMSKHYGAHGTLLYRLATLVASSIRLVALGLLKLIALFSSRTRRSECSGAFFKHRLLVLWALGLRKPLIGN